MLKRIQNHTLVSTIHIYEEIVSTLYKNEYKLKQIVRQFHLPNGQKFNQGTRSMPYGKIQFPMLLT